MSKQTTKPFQTPENIAQILKDFTREILRIQPYNIYEFGYKYFASKAELEERMYNTTNHTKNNLSFSSEEELITQIIQIGNQYSFDSAFDLILVAKFAISEVVSSISQTQLLFALSQLPEIMDGSVEAFGHYISKIVAPKLFRILSDKLFETVSLDDINRIKGMYKTDFQQEIRDLFSDEVITLPSVYNALVESKLITFSEREIALTIAGIEVEEDGTISLEKLVDSMCSLITLAEYFDSHQ